MVEAQISRRRIAKPIGLYLIAIFDFIAVGLFQLVISVLVARNAETELPFIAVLISIGLAVFTMAASVWAWIGDNAGRYLLLGLVTVSSLLVILNVIIIIPGDETGSNDGFRAMGGFIRALVWLGLNWWYFNRQHVVAYFKQSGS